MSNCVGIETSRHLSSLNDVRAECAATVESEDYSKDAFAFRSEHDGQDKTSNGVLVMKTTAFRHPVSKPPGSLRTWPSFKETSSPV